MDNIRTPKQVLFGELPSKRPCHGVKKRWRDIVLHDLKNMNVPEASWYTLAQDRTKWKTLVNDCCQLFSEKVFNLNTLPYMIVNRKQSMYDHVRDISADREIEHGTLVSAQW
jgi:hypothetical protein